MKINSRYLKLRSGAINGAHFLRLYNRLNDAPHVALEIEGPLVQRAHSHSHLATHPAIPFSLFLLQRSSWINCEKDDKAKVT